MIPSAWELIEPSAVPCIQGPQKAIAAMSALQGHPVQICTIVHDPESSEIHFISDDSYGLPPPTLSSLKQFLSLELSARSRAAEDEVQLCIDDDEEILEGKDCLAEENLEKELEQMAENDPDVIELADCLKKAAVSADRQEERQEESGKSEHLECQFEELRESVVMDLDQEECLRENSTIVTVEGQTSMDICEEPPEDSEMHSLAEAEEMQELRQFAEVECNRVELRSAHEPTTTAALTLDKETISEMTASVDYDGNNNRLSDDSCTDLVSEKVKRRRTRQVLDYVEVPHLPPRPHHQVHTYGFSQEKLALRMTGTRVSRGGGRSKRKKRSRSTSPTSPDITYPFILTEEERSNTPKPATLSPRDSPDAYLKRIFHIDLARVPGRKPLPSFQAGKVSKQTNRKPVKQNDAAVPAANKLIPDDDLQSIGCVYLSDYDIIVCRNLHNGRPCGYGIPLVNLFSHCWGSDSLASLHTCERSPHYIEFCKRYDSHGSKNLYSYKQRSFIQRILHNHPNVIVTVKEMRSIRMREDQFGSISYICPPVPGFACNFCEFAVHQVEGGEPLSMREHWLGHAKEDPERHGRLPRGTDLQNTDKFRQCQVQSFDRDQAHFLWLPVPPEKLSHAHTNFPSKSFAQILLFGLQSRSQSAVTGDASRLRLDPKAVLPFLVQNRSFELVSPLPPDYVAKLISLPAKKGDSDPFHKLKLATAKRFQRLCDEIPNVSSVVRKLLVVPKPGEKSLLDSFNRPQQDSTVQSYALEETRLLCFVLRCLQASQYSIGDLEGPVPSGEGLHIGLTENQAHRFQALLEYLSDPSHDSEPNSTLESLIDAALCSIYMPSNSLEMFDNVLRNPTTIYVILRSLRPQGGFLQAKEATVRYAPIQFGIRLTIMAKVQERYRGLQSEKQKGVDGEALYEELMKYTNDTISRWASREHNTPLGFVRQCMKAMSRVARNMPASPTVAWNPDHSKITVQNHVVEVAEYIEEVQKSLSSLSRTVDDNILFGFEFPSGSLDLARDNSETNDINTLGFGLFTIPTESNSQLDSDNHPAAFFLERLCEAKEICTRQGNSVIWDAQRANKWLLDVSEVWAETLTLMHLLAIPGRGTEVTTWQYTNSPSSPRHLFLSTALQTLITQSSYNKTTAITGRHKYILRVIPFRLSLIITKLLRIIRPIESLAFASLNPANASEAKEVYSTYMFVSNGKVWDSNTLSASLRRWFLRALRVPFGLHLHRHFVQALQRQFLRYEKDDELSDVANEVMGHGREVADHNYAREGQDLSLDSSTRRRMEIVGFDWISKVHGIEVSPVEKGKRKAS